MNPELTMMAAQIAMLQAELELQSVILMQVMISGKPDPKALKIVDEQIVKRDAALSRMQETIDRMIKVMEDSI